MSSSTQQFDTNGLTLAPFDASIMVHREACVAIFESNLPEFVTRQEQEPYETFLDSRECDYFMVKTDAGGVVACGGFHAQPEEARLCWGLVERRFHRRGIGRYLLLSRLLRIHERGGSTMVTMDTSQLTCAFFAPFGFREVDRIEHGYRAGLHKIEMELELNERSVESLRCHLQQVRP